MRRHAFWLALLWFCSGSARASAGELRGGNAWGAAGVWHIDAARAYAPGSLLLAASGGLSVASDLFTSGDDDTFTRVNLRLLGAAHRSHRGHRR